MSTADTATIPADRADRADLTGLVVLDPTGRRLGEIRELVTDTEGRYAFLAVTSGGLHGLATTERLIPLETVRRVDAAVHIDRTVELVRSWRPQDPGLDAPSAYAAVYHHYDLHPAATEPTVDPD